MASVCVSHYTSRLLCLPRSLHLRPPRTTPLPCCCVPFASFASLSFSRPPLAFRQRPSRGQIRRRMMASMGEEAVTALATHPDHHAVT